MIDGTYSDTVITGKDPSSDKESVLALQLRRGSEGDTYLRKQSDSAANAGEAGRDTNTGMVTMINCPSQVSVTKGPMNPKDLHICKSD